MNKQHEAIATKLRKIYPTKRLFLVPTPSGILMQCGSKELIRRMLEQGIKMKTIQRAQSGKPGDRCRRPQAPRGGGRR
jgi:hypothetical protein